MISRARSTEWAPYSHLVIFRKSTLLAPFISAEIGSMWRPARFIPDDFSAGSQGEELIYQTGSSARSRLQARKRADRTANVSPGRSAVSSYKAHNPSDRLRFHPSVFLVVDLAL